MDAVTASVKNWLSKPYRGEGSAFEWFAFIGLVLIAAYIWSRIIRDFELMS